MNARFDGTTVEYRQILLVASKKDFVIDNFNWSLVIREVLLYELFQMRILFVGNDKNLANKRSKTQNGCHAIKNFSFGTKAGRSCDIVRLGRLRIEIRFHFVLMFGVIPIHPGYYNIDVGRRFYWRLGAGTMIH